MGKAWKTWHSAGTHWVFSKRGWFLPLPLLLVL